MHVSITKAILVAIPNLFNYSGKLKKRGGGAGGQLSDLLSFSNRLMQGERNLIGTLTKSKKTSFESSQDDNAKPQSLPNLKGLFLTQ